MSQARRRGAFVALAVVVGLVISTTTNRAEGATSTATKVIVRLASGTTATPADLLAPVNGTLDRTLPVINGFSAWVPAENRSRLDRIVNNKVPYDLKLIQVPLKGRADNLQSLIGKVLVDDRVCGFENLW